MCLAETFLQQGVDVEYLIMIGIGTMGEEAGMQVEYIGVKLRIPSGWTSSGDGIDVGVVIQEGVRVQELRAV